MKLYYSITSPYSRKVLLTAKSLGYGDQITLVLGSSLEAGSTLHTINPLAKVPALQLDNGQVIFDSPVIVEYFLGLAGAEQSGPAYFRQRQIEAVADGLMDAAVAKTMETRRPDGAPSDFWMGRWETAILRSAAYTEATFMEDLDSWQFGTIGLACALDYVCFRQPDINWQQAAPKLATWYETVCQKPAMVETDPRKG